MTVAAPTTAPGNLLCTVFCGSEVVEEGDCGATKKGARTGKFKLRASTVPGTCPFPNVVVEGAGEEIFCETVWTPAVPAN